MDGAKVQHKANLINHAIPDSKIEEVLNATQNDDGIITVERLKQLSSEEVLACLTANCCHDGMPK